MQARRRAITQTARARDEIAQAYPRAAWVTASGAFDPSKFPIEPLLGQSLNPSIETFRTACTLLGSMASHGRVDAGVYLLGLLRYYEHDLRRIDVITEALRAFRDDACATALFHELRRVKSSNATRRYLDKVIATLAFAFIAAYTQLNGRPPAETDMQRYFKVTPPSVHSMILTLERRGLIGRMPGQARSIEVLVPREQLPVLG